MEQFERVTGKVRLRRTMQVKPSMEPWDGLHLEFIAMYLIEDDDIRYPGEWALMPLADGFPEGWIASGDVEMH